MTVPYKDITLDPNAKPTSNERSPAAAPITPGVRRPGGAQPKAATDRQLRASLAERVMRFFGFTAYQAEVAERVVGVYIIGDLTKQPIDEETRTGADYKVIPLDLSVAHNRTPIDGTQDLVMSNVALTQLTASGTFRLHIGDRDGILFGGTGLGIGNGVEMQPPEQTRLAITNTAQPATTAEIVVSAGVRVTL